MKLKKFFAIVAIMFCFILPFAAACGNTELEAASGSLCSFEDAYANGLLTATDIKDVSYYMYGYVKEYEYDEDGNCHYTQIDDYTPSTALTELSEAEIHAIKYAFYLDEIDLFKLDYSDFASCEDDIHIKFYGEYNGCYVVIIGVDDWDYITAMMGYHLGGVYLDTNYPLPEVFTFYEISE